MTKKTAARKKALFLSLLFCAVFLLSGCGKAPGAVASAPKETAVKETAEKEKTSPAPEETAASETKEISDPKRVQKLIEEIAVGYGTFGEQFLEKAAKLLEEISAIDPGAADRMQRVLDLWTSEDLGKPVHYNILPDGLPETNELCIVVLGFQLEPDGGMKQELVERLNTALKSAQKYPNAYVVCTGGGTAAENPSATEAGEMAKWLIEHGVEKSRVIVEDHSVTTAQNAVFTYDILTSLYPSVKKLAIVSSDYHLATGELVFQAESILRASAPGNEKLSVVSNAAWKAPSGSLSALFQAGAVIELFGDIETAFEIYFETYDLHSLPSLG